MPSMKLLGKEGFPKMATSFKDELIGSRGLKAIARCPSPLRPIETNDPEAGKPLSS